MSSSPELTSSTAPSPPCAGCKHLRRRCVRGCAFAPYFPPEHGERFAVVHAVFGASNVSKLLSEIEPGERADAVQSLVYEADARARDPAFGCVSYITVLQSMLKQAKGQVAAARSELAGRVGVAAAFQPFDAAAAPRAVKRVGEAQLAAALGVAREQDDVMRAMRQAVEAAKRKKQGRREAEVAVVGTGPGVPRGHGEPQRNQQMMQQMAEAQQAAATAQAAREQSVMMRQAAAAQQHGHPVATQHAWKRMGVPDGHVHGHPRQQTAQPMAEAHKSGAREQAMMVRQPAAAQQRSHPVVAQHAGTGLAIFPDGHRRQQIPQHESVVAAEVASEMDVMMMLRQAAAAKQHHNPAAQAQQHAHQEMLQQMAEAQQLAAAAEVARKQDVMMRQTAAAQKHHHQAAGQCQAMGLDVTLGRREQPSQDQQTALQVAEAERLAAIAEQYYHPAVLYAAMGREQPHSRQQTVLQMAQAQMMAAAEEIARDQTMMLREAADAGLAMDQNMMMMLQAAAEQQQHHRAALGLDVTPGHGQPDPNQQIVQQIVAAQELSAAAELAREQDVVMMQQAAAYAQAVPRSRSGALLPVGSTDAEAFLAQQQPQPQPQAENAPGLQMDASLPPLPPSLAQLPRQQHNVGGDEGQSSDKMVHIGVRDPNLPPDGRPSRW